MEHMNESTEMTKQPDYLLLDHAQGAIEASAEQQERLDEVTELLAQGEFHKLVEGYGVCKCIDGRSGGYGIYPNVAGGTETLLVADDLTTKRFATESGTTADAYGALIDHLDAQRDIVGGHTDDHAHGEMSGCGANDKLDKIYKFIANSGDVLYDLADKLGVVVDDETHEMIVANAAARTEFSTGAELLDVLKEAEEPHIEELLGAHNEVVAVINTIPDTSLDRTALTAKFGTEYQAFNVDAWAFEIAAQKISNDEDEVTAKVAAMAYYNLATAHVLCGKNMRVVVL